MLVSLALTMMVPEAAACGGFFCNNIEPVKQAGEIIVFEVDPEAGETGKTTMHVQVEYEGPPIEFAWVVPVKGTPDLFVSNDTLFTALGQRTRPQFYLEYEALGTCDLWRLDFAADAGSLPPAPNAPLSEGVNVLASEQVGPYDTVVLQADNEAVLIQWLQDNDYNVPSSLGSVLSPYVAADHNFVALRLSNGQETGDLVPLGLRYDGVQPAIPIQLTSVAASDDMQLITYVLGPDRAVPENYLHVELNESAIDWFSNGSNYMDVLSRAANQAGGHAFTTEFSGSTDPFVDTFFRPEWAALDLSTASGPTEFIQQVTNSGLPASAALLDILTTSIQLPDGYDARDVFNCPGCYPELDSVVEGFDLASAAASVEDRIIAPLRAIDAMFDRAPHLTRLGSTMSPAEMSVDPVFTFNGDIDQTVSNIHSARLIFDCDEADDDEALATAPKDLVLSNGTSIRIPSGQALAERGLTDSTFVSGLLEPAASEIASLGSTGPKEILYDGTIEIDDNIQRLNDEADDIEGRGCNTAAGGMGLWMLALLPLALRRRS